MLVGYLLDIDFANLMGLHSEAAREWDEWGKWDWDIWDSHPDKNFWSGKSGILERN